GGGGGGGYRGGGGGGYSGGSRSGGGYYGGGGGGFGFAFLTPQMIAIIAVIAVVFFIMNAVQQARARKAAEKAAAISVAKVQLGFDAGSTVGLRDEIEKLVRTANVGTDVGLWRLAQGVLERVQRELDNIHYAGWTEHKELGPSEGEAVFNRIASEARSHFDREIVRRDASGLKEQKRNSDKANELFDEDGEFGIAEFFVVTLAMAAQGGPIDLPPAVGGHDDVAAAVAALKAVPLERHAGFEVVWTPAAESDILMRDEVLTDYPELAPL
ncbi:MAG: DUF1517 domain-containing protein, partial [Myxococcales bacterium]|nr:DUF1517 domain-containing protein [Myxococcales bacterium]